MRLNTTQAERSIDNMVRKINQMNNALNKTCTNKVEQQLRRSNTQVNSIATRVRTWANNQRQVLSHTKSTNNALSSIGSRLRGIAATYLGIMGAKTLANTSDTITSAQNKLNYVNGSQLGSAGYTSDGKDYSNATFNATAESMDKMYASAQRVRMGYDDMMNNVSKSMVLAGDSFDGSIDNAIRFQEIMAEAYSVGGASAQEMSSSMYQLIQALGAGTLAGDELRSVREGASLAYDKIEDFVQGVYNSEESLKDLASQGKVTADMVVAAVMNMGDEMDKAFAMTKQTFAQTWEQIKNSALKAFEPVSNRLRDMLNRAIDNGLIEKVETIFSGVANVILWIIDLIGSAVNWIAQNWYWLQYVVLGVILVIIYHLIIWTLQTIASAVIRIAMYIAEYWWLLLIVATIVMLIYIYIQWKNAAIDTCTAIAYALFVVAAMILIIGIVTFNVVFIVMAIVIAALAFILMNFSETCGWIMVGIMWLKNAWFSFCNFWIAVWNAACVIGANIWAWFRNVGSASMGALEAICHNALAGMINGFVGFGNVVSAIGTNIRIAFSNAWNGALYAFWNFIADCLEGLSWLEGPLNAISQLFGGSGFSMSGLAGDVRGKAGSYAPESFVSIPDAWSSGASSIDYWDVGAAWDKGMNSYQYGDIGSAWSEGLGTYDTWADGWKDDAYNQGFEWGQGIEDAINQWGSKFQTGGGDFGLGDLFNSLIGGTSSGSDPFGGANIAPGKLDELIAGLPSSDGSSALDPYNAPSAGDLLDGVDNLNKGVGGIGSDTGSIADSMDLAEEDLAYLRDLADREWKKEFTTANITVDMSNYNTINGENDLDGIVTKLADKLYEEMNSLADGVYA